MHIGAGLVVEIAVAQLFMKTPKAATQPTTMLRRVLSMLAEDCSPAMNDKTDVAAMRRFSGIKNNPVCAVARLLSQGRSQGRGRSGGESHTGTRQILRERVHLLTEAVKHEVARSKLVLHEGALADLGQHPGGAHLLGGFGYYLFVAWLLLLLRYHFRGLLATDHR